MSHNDNSNNNSSSIVNVMSPRLEKIIIIIVAAPTEVILNVPANLPISIETGYDVQIY